MVFILYYIAASIVCIVYYIAASIVCIVYYIARGAEHFKLSNIIRFSNPNSPTKSA